jgi:DNA-binding GntR family transcriptional regulator
MNVPVLESQIERDQTLEGQVQHTLKQSILDGVLAPGTRLKYQELAAEMGVSPTPVRSAIKLLESEGLVETVPYVGSTVKCFSAEEISDLYDVRLSLGTLAAKLAAENADQSQLERMESLVHKFQDAVERGDRRASLGADWDLHRVIAEASGNATLLELVTLLSARVQMLFQMDRGPGRLDQSLRDHQAILDAVKRRDANAAADRMREHIRRGKAHLLGAMADVSKGADSDRTGRFTDVERETPQPVGGGAVAISGVRDGS